MTLGAMAAEELYVGGKKVTLSGSGTVTVSGGDIKSGSVEYDCTSKTLTLNGVTITRSGDNNRGIRSSVSGLTVKFVGTNTITTTTAAGLRFEASTTITGSGTVTVTSNETAFYVYKNTTVTIKGVDRNRLTLTLNGKYGIQGEDGSSSEKVSIQRYVTLTAIGTSNALKYLSDLTVNGDADLTLKVVGWNPAIQSLASLTLGEGVAIDLPLQGKFNSSKKTVVKGSATTDYMGDVTIKSAIAINATNFPDANFRSYVTSSGFDQNSDNHLSNAEIQLVTMINVNSKGISNLKGIGYFTALTDLACSNNSLQSLDVSSNTKLTNLLCGSNSSMTSLTVSANTALEQLDCRNNSLGTLDVSANTALKKLYCDGNGMTSLTVSKKCTALTMLSCTKNQIKGDNMTALVNGLPSVSGILVVCAPQSTVDNVIIPSQVKIATDKGWKVVSILSVDGEDIYYDYEGVPGVEINSTNFPDANFRSYLKAQDYGKDNYITNDELATVTSIDVHAQGISNLKGIEHFTKLQELRCHENSLTSLDITNNTELTYLNCRDNSFGENGLNVSKNKKLTYLQCRNTGLTRLDITQNTQLTSLYCLNNSLESLDVSKNTKLSVMNCSGNKLTSLDVLNNTQLTDLECYTNRLSSLNVSKNKKLKKLLCYQNNINAVNMESLVNTLPTREEKDGNFYVLYNDKENNEILSAQVQSAKDKGWNVLKYNGSSWVNYAGAAGIRIYEMNFPDENFRSYLLSQDYGQDGILTEAELKAVTEMDVTTLMISNLRGIEYFTELTKLYCQGNILFDLDVSKNTKLEVLGCDFNGLGSLDVSKNTALRILSCSVNGLKSLDLSANKALTNLDCCKNHISGDAMTALVNSLPGVTGGELVAFDDDDDNEITRDQVQIATGKGWKVKRWSKGTLVDYAGFVPIAIDATNFPDEKFRNYLLAKDYGKDGILNYTELKAVTEMDVSVMGISNLKGIEYFTALKVLICYINGLKSLDVSKNTALEVLSCWGCHLENLDVSKNTALIGLYCSYNSLTSLDVSTNTKLMSLNCYYNQISGADMTKLVNSLPSLPSGEDGDLTVSNDMYVPDNVITAAQVKIATDKGWTVKKVDNDNNLLVYAGQGDVNGDNKIDQSDLDLIVRIIMGKLREDVGKYAGDLNKDGKTDATDIVLMNNILKSLGK